MRYLMLLVFLVGIHVHNYSMIIKDPKLAMPTKDKTKTPLSSYNPYSIYVPSNKFLQKLSADRVLDMGATAYAANFLTKSMYFYTNAMNIFEKDPDTYYWAVYEAGFIYFRRKESKKALEYFDIITQARNAPTTTKKLATEMSFLIRNKDEYKTLLKQEDLVFLADKKARSVLDKQIAKEERQAEKAQRKLAKERKKREKEEKQLLKEQQNLEKQKIKEEKLKLKQQQKLADQKAKEAKKN